MIKKSQSPETPVKNPGGRPRKPGTLMSFKLAPDVASHLSTLNENNGKGAMTEFVERAVRKLAKLPDPPKS